MDDHAPQDNPGVSEDLLLGKFLSHALGKRVKVSEDGSVVTVPAAVTEDETYIVWQGEFEAAASSRAWLEVDRDGGIPAAPGLLLVSRFDVAYRM
jgi:hypothetical protein